MHLECTCIGTWNAPRVCPYTHLHWHLEYAHIRTWNTPIYAPGIYAPRSGTCNIRTWIRQDTTLSTTYTPSHRRTYNAPRSPQKPATARSPLHSTLPTLSGSTKTLYGPLFGLWRHPVQLPVCQKCASISPYAPRIKKERGHLGPRSAPLFTFPLSHFPPSASLRRAPIFHSTVTPPTSV